VSDEDFTFSKNNITIYFDAYEMGSYSLGEPVISIPINQIKELIDHNGPVKFTFDNS